MLDVRAVALWSWRGGGWGSWKVDMEWLRLLSKMLERGNRKWRLQKFWVGIEMLEVRNLPGKRGRAEVR